MLEVDFLLIPFEDNVIVQYTNIIKKGDFILSFKIFSQINNKKPQLSKK